MPISADHPTTECVFDRVTTYNTSNGRDIHIFSGKAQKGLCRVDDLLIHLLESEVNAINDGHPATIHCIPDNNPRNKGDWRISLNYYKSRPIAPISESREEPEEPQLLEVLTPTQAISGFRGVSFDLSIEDKDYLDTLWKKYRATDPKRFHRFKDFATYFFSSVITVVRLGDTGSPTAALPANCPF